MTKFCNLTTQTFLVSRWSCQGLISLPSVTVSSHMYRCVPIFF